MEDLPFYEHITNVAERVVLKLTEESRGQLDESNQSHWDMANGVVRLWRELAGGELRDVDATRLEGLLEAMPGVDDPGSGDWHLTAVTHIR